MKKIYYGGSDDTWTSICKVPRGDVDVEEIIFNAELKDLGISDAGKNISYKPAEVPNSTVENNNAIDNQANSEYYQKGKKTGDKLAEDLSNIDWNTKQAEASQKGKEAAEKLNRAISGSQ